MCKHRLTIITLYLSLIVQNYRFYINGQRYILSTLINTYTNCSLISRSPNSINKEKREERQKSMVDDRNTKIHEDLRETRQNRGH